MAEIRKMAGRVWKRLGRPDLSGAGTPTQGLGVSPLGTSPLGG